MAERSKAPDSRSGPRKRAWVRTPLLTNFFFNGDAWLGIVLHKLHGLQVLNEDAVAEWLRRWTANPLGFPREGSNPFCVE